MKTLISAVIVFLCLAAESFCGEVISSGVEIKDGVYSINIKISVDVKKEKVMGIYNDPVKLKKLSNLIKEADIIEKEDNGEIKKVKAVKICFFLCMQTIQNNIAETGDKAIEIVIPDQNNFNAGVMNLEISPSGEDKTIISCGLEANPKITTKALLIFVSKKMIENKLTVAGAKAIKKIEKMSADGDKIITVSDK